MTVEECARTITREVRQAVNRAYFRKTTEPEILSAVTETLLALVRATNERCLEIVKRYKQLDADSWGPGASNRPDWSKAYNEILATSPGKGAG